MRGLIIVEEAGVVTREMYEALMRMPKNPNIVHITGRQTMSKYRKKPVVVEARQWGVANGPAVAEVTLLSELPGDHPAHKIADEKYGRGYYKPWSVGWIGTLEGGHLVEPHDWIITGVEGEMYPCKPGIFTATYEEAEEEPQGVTAEMLSDPWRLHEFLDRCSTVQDIFDTVIRGHAVSEHPEMQPYLDAAEKALGDLYQAAGRIQPE